MKYRKLHSWNVTTEEARAIQERIRARMKQVWDRRPVRAVAGADVGFPDKSTVLAAVVVLTYPDLEVLETQVAERRCAFPYVPGLLAFREAPVLLAALGKLECDPDLLVCDAQGYAHPRKMGLASHVGILLDRPVIGCAKSLLCGVFDPVGRRRGSYSPILDEAGETIGAAVRTRDGVRPVYVSVGNRIDLDAAIDFVLGMGRGYRIPEPLRLAHRLSIGGAVTVGTVPWRRKRR